MESIKKSIESYTETVTFYGMYNFLIQIDFESIEYEKHIPEPETPGDYGRNVFTMDPFECVLIHWPAGIESGIHHHKALFGYVRVLEGEVENVTYTEKDGMLIESGIQRFGAGALIPEPDGVIHKIRNADESHRAITVHFYYPPLRTLEGLRIFDIDSGSVGVLSKDALTASWSDAGAHFKELDKNAFKFVSYDEANKHKSHFMSNVIPKPMAERITEMNSKYFCEQAEQYDFYDFNLPKRKSYIDTIDELVSTSLQSLDVKSVLDIACGTGRRALKIRDMSSLEYKLSGIDVSEKMCEIARERGIDAHHEDWLSSSEHADEVFGAITFLYAFGHLPSRAARLDTLKKINAHLEPGGLFCFDVFNRHDRNEWGPQASMAFEQGNLEQHGYEKGDVFYRKAGFKEYAFVHYFTLVEIAGLLMDAGFDLEDWKVVGYSQNAGEQSHDLFEGNLFLKARKI